MRFLGVFLFLVSMSWVSPSLAQTITLAPPSLEQQRLDSVKKVYEAKLIEVRKSLDSIPNLSRSLRRYSRQRLGLLQGLYLQKQNEAKNLFKKDVFHIREADMQFSCQFGERVGESPIQLQPTFMRIQSSLKADLFNIPLQIEQFWTSGRAEINQPMNYFSVNFDWQSQQQKMRREIDAQINNIAKQAIPLHLIQLDKLKGMEDQFGDISILKQEILRYKELDSLLSSEQGKALKNKALEEGKKQAFKQTNKHQEKLKEKAQSNKITKILYEEKDALKDTKGIEKKLKAKAKKEQDKYIQEAKDSLQTLERNKMDSISKKLRDTVSIQRKKIEKFLEKEKMTIAQLEALARWKDSLVKMNAEDILRHETITNLRNFKNANFTEQLGSLHKMGIFTSATTILRNIRQFKLGTTTPVYSSLVMQGMPLNGVHIEYQPRKLFLAVSAGKATKMNPWMKQYNRDITAGTIGWGAKEQNHAHLHFLRGVDIANDFKGDSLLQGIGDTLYYAKPRAGMLVATDFKWEWAKKMSIKLEMARSLTNVDITENTWRWNDWQKNSLLWAPTQQEGNFKQGWAIMADAKGQLGKNTQVQLKIRRIAPDFYSLGLPYLRNDLQGFDASFTHNIFKNKLTIKPFYGRWQDNVLKQKNIGTFLSKYGGSALLKIDKMPHFMLTYQANDIARGEAIEKIEIWQAQSQYTYHWGGIDFVSEVLITYNKQPQMLSETQLGGMGIQTNQWNLTQQMSFSNRWQVRATIGKMREQNNLVDASGNRSIGRWFQYQIEGQCTFFGIWQNQLSGMYGTKDTGGTRKGIQFTSRFQWDRLSFTGGFTLNEVKLGAGFDYTERLGSVGLGWRF
jgi:hypothetical protein